MKELYPNVNIKLFKRGNIRSLLIKYGLEQEARRLWGTGAQEAEA